MVETNSPVEKEDVSEKILTSDILAEEPASTGLKKTSPVNEINAATSLEHLGDHLKHQSLLQPEPEQKKNVNVHESAMDAMLDALSAKTSKKESGLLRVGPLSKASNYSNVSVTKSQLS